MQVHPQSMYNHLMKTKSLAKQSTYRERDSPLEIKKVNLKKSLDIAPLELLRVQ